MLSTQPSTAIGCVCAALAAATIVAGCGGSSGGQRDTAALYSPKKIVKCLAKRGVSNEVEPASQLQLQPGDVPLFQSRGEVGAYVGGALVTIEVVGKGDNLAFYEGAAPPR